MKDGMYTLKGEIAILSEEWLQEQYLLELRAIRELLEWQKQDTLTMREQWKAEQEQTKAEKMAEEERQKAEFIAINEQMLEKAKQNNLAIQRQLYEDHERRYHGAPAEKKEIVN